MANNFEIYSKLYPDEKILWQGNSVLTEFIKWMLVYLILTLAVITIIFRLDLIPSAFFGLFFFIILVVELHNAKQFPYYSVTNKRIILTYWSPLRKRGKGIFVPIYERSVFLKNNPKNRPELVDPNLSKIRLAGELLETKIGEGIVKEIYAKKLFLDLFGRKSIVLVTDAKKQGKLLLNYFTNPVTSPFVIKGIKNCDEVLEIIKSNTEYEHKNNLRG